MAKFKDCIACAEQIQANAMLCKHCKTRQDDESFKPIEKSANTDMREPMPSSLECPRCREKSYLNAVCERCGFKGQQQPGLADSPKKTGWGLLFDTREENQTARRKFRFYLILSISLTLVFVIAAGLMNPGSLSSVFQTQNPYFQRGYEAAQLYADKNTSPGYAYAFCSVLGANTLGPIDAVAVNQFIDGCQTYILEPTK